MNKQIYLILEIFWLIIGILGLAAGIHQTTKQNLKESWPFFLIAVLGIAMFLIRRNLRKKLSK